MTAIIGRGVKVEIEKTVGAAKTVSAISLAKPGVATSAAHSLANKSIGYFLGVTGMVQLDGQAVRLANQATNTFELEDIDTTDYAAFTSGTFVPVTAWATMNTATSYQIGGGDADPLDNTTLIDDIKQELNGLLGAQNVAFNLNSETISGEAMAIIKAAARKSASLTVRITLKDGSVRVFRGQPSLPGENVQKGAIGTGNLTFKVKGFVTEGAA